MNSETIILMAGIPMLCWMHSIYKNYKLNKLKNEIIDEYLYYRELADAYQLIIISMSEDIIAQEFEEAEEEEYND